MSHRTVMIPLLLVLLVSTEQTVAFLIRSNFSSMPMGNISCLFHMNSPYDEVNFTASVQNMHFCVIKQMTRTLHNGTLISAMSGSAILWYDAFKRYISARCSAGQFRPSITPIGHASCSGRSYEPYTEKLCICSTDNCNSNYSACVASVQATQATPPPNLPEYAPELSSSTSCQLGSRGSTYLDIVNPNTSATLEMPFFKTNRSEALAYASNHAVACYLFFNAKTGDWLQHALMYENYDDYLYPMLSTMYAGIGNIYAETSTSVASQFGEPYHINITYSNDTGNYFKMCVCTTNNCNRNLSTCVNGLNGNGFSTTLPFITSTSGNPNSTNQTTVAPTTSSKSK